MKSPLWAAALFFAVIMAVSAYAGSARILRVTMNDGSTKQFLVNYISKITFTATDQDISSSSAIVESSSSVASSSSTIKESSSSVASSSSATEKSSSSVASSSSATEKSSSSVASSSSATKTSSSSVASSSSVTVESSSSEEEHSTGIVTADFKSNVIWDARQQTLLLYSEREANARVTIFDIHGIRLGRLNFAVVSGFNGFSLSNMNLANGKYVLHVDLGGKRSQNVIAIGSAK
ncbi:hypothetical protein [Fibrobacter sp. UWB5]|uniref:hypothetical protein n=1 Tax=Fibrobacter sp. UWB5 TaxID=1964360 RepID=UPI0011848B71|nr:hypothetical protein [Fibrobacter sp. UWB5]